MPPEQAPPSPGRPPLGQASPPRHSCRHRNPPMRPLPRHADPRRRNRAGTAPPRRIQPSVHPALGAPSPRCTQPSVHPAPRHADPLRRNRARQPDRRHLHGNGHRRAPSPARQLPSRPERRRTSPPTSADPASVPGRSCGRGVVRLRPRPVSVRPVPRSRRALPRAGPVRRLQRDLHHAGELGACGATCTTVVSGARQAQHPHHGSRHTGPSRGTGPALAARPGPWSTVARRPPRSGGGAGSGGSALQ